MVGVNHFDPLGRADLLARLRELAATHSDLPTFVALEYDQQQFGTLAAQRPHFCKVLRDACPDLSDDELNTLVSSLVYEGDAHREVFPATPALWLDEGRVLDSDSDLSGYADRRAQMYIGHARGKLHGASQNISQAIKAMPPSRIDCARTQKFAVLIQQRLRGAIGTWAIVITGSAHASTSEGSMRQLLEAEGINCA